MLTMNMHTKRLLAKVGRFLSILTVGGTAGAGITYSLMPTPEPVILNNSTNDVRDEIEIVRDNYDNIKVRQWKNRGEKIGRLEAVVKDLEARNTTLTEFEQEQKSWRKERNQFKGCLDKQFKNKKTTMTKTEYDKCISDNLKSRKP